MLNKNLLISQEITTKGEASIVALHGIMDDVTENHEEYGNQKEVLAIVQSLEYTMQALWKFDRDKNYHRYTWNLRDCTCPRMDNIERIGTLLKIVSVNCPFHGN